MNSSYTLTIPLNQELLIVILVSLVFVAMLVNGLFCGIVAGEKGYSVGVWFILGFLFGTIALIASAGLPDKHARSPEAMLSKYR